MEHSLGFCLESKGMEMAAKFSSVVGQINRPSAIKMYTACVERFAYFMIAIFQESLLNYFQVLYGNCIAYEIP